MNFADWYAKREPRYKEWRNRWKSKVNMENALLYAVPALVMAIAPIASTLR